MPGEGRSRSAPVGLSDGLYSTRRHPDEMPHPMKRRSIAIILIVATFYSAQQPRIMISLYYSI